MKRRLFNLFLGLLLYGVSLGLMVRADLGLASWDVLHQGLARRTGIPLGWVVNAVGALVLLLWWPLRQRPGIGTVANVVVVGFAAQAVIAAVPDVRNLPWRIGLLTVGILLNGLATGLYVGAGLGPGPRDGLMTGLASRGKRGHSIRLVRTVIEVTVLAAGWLLGGTVGVGTLAYTLAIGPFAQFSIEKFSIPRDHEKVSSDPSTV